VRFRYGSRSAFWTICDGPDQDVRGAPTNLLDERTPPGALLAEDDDVFRISVARRRDPVENDLDLSTPLAKEPLIGDGLAEWIWATFDAHETNLPLQA